LPNCRCGSPHEARSDADRVQFRLADQLREAATAIEVKPAAAAPSRVRRARLYSVIR